MYLLKLFAVSRNHDDLADRIARNRRSILKGISGLSSLSLAGVASAGTSGGTENGTMDSPVVTPDANATDPTYGGGGLSDED